MKSERYSMSFTTGGLFYHESIIVVQIYLELRDWSEVRKRVMEKNLLQSRSLNSAKRIFREISSRLKKLTDEQMKILGDGSRQEQNFILWLSICKRYKFIHDFTVEVVREKFFRLDMELSYDDYDAFFNAKAEWNEDMDRLADETKSKLRQLVFKMMREADLLSRKHTIMPPILTPRVVKAIINDSPSYFAVFPLTEIEGVELPTRNGMRK